MQDADGNWLVCCIKGCEAKPHSVGLCLNHWRLNVKYGSPVTNKIAPYRWLRLSFEERFWLNVKKSEGCWIWQGGKDRDGYGIFAGKLGDETFKKAHRYSFALHKGQSLPGLSVCHSCDIPDCVNPSHLILGDTAYNMADKMAKGRHRSRGGEDHYRAILTEDQAKTILGDPRPHSKIAAEYGVSTQAISSLKTRVSWPHLGAEKGVKAKRVSPRKGVSEKITPEIVREIRTGAERGVALAARLGVTSATITDIRKRRSWAHIE